MLIKGPEALNELEILRGRVKRVIAEIPLKASDVVWTESDAYAFTEPELAGRLEDLIGLKTRTIHHGIRPIFMLGESP
jgi:hypothetical protein